MLQDFRNRNGHSHIQSSNTVCVIISHIGTVYWKIFPVLCSYVTFKTSIGSKHTTAAACPQVFTEPLGLRVALSGYWWCRAEPTAKAKRCTATCRRGRLRQRDIQDLCSAASAWLDSSVVATHLPRSPQKAFGTSRLRGSKQVNETLCGALGAAC